MARIDKVHIARYRAKHVNVCAPVGVGEVNKKDDVMLIQAVFRIINAFAGNSYLFGDLAKNLPEPTGIFDERTMWTIWTFELNLRNQLLKADGKIHPAKYANRHIKNSTNNARLMTITRMNFLTMEGLLMEYNGIPLPGAVVVEAPSIAFSCSKEPVDEPSVKSQIWGS